jgi:hypothetical protein
MERLNLEKLNVVEVKEQYLVKISNRCAAFENLDDDDGDDDTDINRACESIRENKKASAVESLGYYDLKQHKSWLDEECSK